jgi:type IV pilus assembly protein PilM
MARNTVSLYIDDTSIRLMVTRGKRITRLADAPLDVSLNDIDTDEKEKELTEKVRNLLKSNRIHAKKVILGLSGLHCLTRPVVLPELPRAMLNEAVTREAKRVLPVPVEQLYISWQIVAVAEGKIQAFMVATPRQIADMAIRVLNQAGCKPYLMDIKPLALARLSKEATALIVDVQSKEFDIVILVNGIPQPIRTVAFPEEELSLAEKLSIVKDDVKRTIQFYNTNSGDNPIQPNTTMFVSGELAYEPELYESLANELGFKASLVTSPLKCLKQLDPSHYLVNVGLALKEAGREASPSLPNFNTLPVPYQPKQVPLNWLLAVPAAGAAIGIVVMLVMTVQNAAADIEAVQNQLNTTQFMLEKKQADKKELLQAITEKEQQIAGTEAAYGVYTNALKIMNRTGDLIDTDLKAAVDNIVDNFHLEAIAHSGSEINITGSADSEQEVLEYVRKLDATGRFSEITIITIKLNAAGASSDNSSVGYSLKCALRGDRD